MSTLVHKHDRNGMPALLIFFVLVCVLIVSSMRQGAKTSKVVVDEAKERYQNCIDNRDPQTPYGEAINSCGRIYLGRK